MMRLFGTDGVRGVAGVDLTTDLARSLATAAAVVLKPRRAVVGRDTRPSGPDLEAAIVDGLTRAGVDVDVAGVVPTPAVAYLVTQGLEMGVMISASHNPAPDNGIKFFESAGNKLDDAVEDEIELLLQQPLPAAAQPGRATRLHDGAVTSYVDHLIGTVPRRLTGLRAVVDCANGSAGAVAADAYGGAGADVTLINAESDGRRINDACGATHIAALQSAVTAHGADVGLAHDGDADRCIAVDARGQVVDGDAILAVLTMALHEQGRLANNAVVTTVMTNLGFKQAMASHGISVFETPVGDRYVLERMRAEGVVVGGEQSGHIVLSEHATTGDGILTGLQLLACVAESGRTLEELAAVMTRLPQVLVAVRVQDKVAAMSAPDVAGAIAAAERELREAGRVLVRPSGTEPVIRVMIEADDEKRAEQLAARVASAVEAVEHS
ncbi:MAG: phosphoglucosamine mutase [Actinomycetes bacterium]